MIFALRQHKNISLPEGHMQAHETEKFIQRGAFCKVNIASEMQIAFLRKSFAASTSCVGYLFLNFDGGQQEQLHFLSQT
jgi:hypothetical protein